MFTKMQNTSYDTRHKRIFLNPTALTVGKDLEGSGSVLIDALPGGTDRSQENLAQDSKCPPAPPLVPSLTLPGFTSTDSMKR
jgi:hypothetical protein